MLLVCDSRRLRISALVLRDLIPKVKRDDSLWHSIPTAVDEDLVNVQLAWHDNGSWGRFRACDLYDAIVPLARLSDLDRCCVASGNATFG